MRRRALLLLVLVAISLVIYSLLDGRSPRTPRAPSADRGTGAPKPVQDRETEDEGKSATRQHQPLLMGRVVDAQGQPIAGARVRCNDMDNSKEWKKRPELRTDADGRFRLNTPATMHELMVTAAGYGEEHLRSYPDDPDLRIVMRRACTLAGVIITPDGRPAANARLSFLDSNLRADADGQGRFEMTGVRAGQVVMNGYWDGPVNAPRAPDDTWWGWDWYFDLKPGEERRGLKLTIQGARYSWLPLKLVDENGKPIAGAVIADTDPMQVLDEPGAPTVYDDERREALRVTDADGFVLLRTRWHAGSESYLEIRKGSRTWRRSVRTLPPGTKDVVMLTLSQPMHVTFLVLDEAGHPIPATSEPLVELEDEDFVQEIASDGPRFEFRVDVGQDRYLDYFVNARGYAHLENPRWLPQPRIEVRLQREARVRGRIVDMPQRKDRGKTTKLRMSVFCGEFFARPGPDGRFQFDSLQAGRTVLRILRQVWRGNLDSARTPYVRRVVTLMEGDNDLGDIRLPKPRLYSGRVVDATGRGIGGARVQVLEAGASAVEAGVSRRDGSFSVMLRAVGTLLLVARKPGLASALTPLGKDIVMHASPTIRFWPGDIEWFEAQLRTAEGHRLELDRMSFHRAFRQDGFRFIDLPQGDWNLALTVNSGMVSRSIPVKLEPGRTVTVDLR